MADLDIIEEIHSIFKANNLTLSVAESCTGGLICHLLTVLPEASRFFYGGVVTYFTDAKTRVLGVDREIIHTHGVVSGETAMEMARRVRVLMQTDYAVSTTGNLGPDVLESKEVGLVYIGLSSKNRTTAIKSNFRGPRQQIKTDAAYYALRQLYSFIKKDLIR